MPTLNDRISDALLDKANKAARVHDNVGFYQHTDLPIASLRYTADVWLTLVDIETLSVEQLRAKIVQEIRDNIETFLDRIQNGDPK